MKTTHKRTLTIVVGTMLTFLGFALSYQAYEKENIILKNRLATALVSAINLETDKRTQGFDFFHSYHPTPSSSRQITLSKENETTTLEKTDSIKNLSHAEKFRKAQQTYLFWEKQIQVSVLDSSWCVELWKQGISVQTALGYINNKTKDTVYSHTDTLFYASAYPLEKQTLGVGDEIILQGYAAITPFAVIKQSPGQFILIFILWIGAIVLIVLYMFRNERRDNSRQPSSQTIHLDMDSNLLIFNKQKIELTKDMMLCIKALWDSPEHYASYEELIHLLYGENVEITNGKNRLNQTIKRIRDKLEPNHHGIEILNLPRKGYQLKIKNHSKMTVLSFCHFLHFKKAVF
jgi:DNA-binding winged helix-turn-helix (wHTH) protein